MYQQHSSAYYTKEQQFNDKFPLSIVAVLAVIQMLTTFAIFALEIGHNIIHIRLTNLFVGFWASVPFTVLWVSMFAVVCCCRRRSCATHAVIQNIIAFIFAGVLIGINIAFIRRPNECFFAAGFCNNLAQVNILSIPFECFFDSRSDSCGNTRITLIKVQLAAGVIIAVTCLIYLIIYCAVALRSDRRQISTPANAVMTHVHQQPIPSTVNYQNQPYTIHPNAYQPSAPVMMHAYPPQVGPGVANMNYLPPNQYPTMYPKIPNDRF